MKKIAYISIFIFLLSACVKEEVDFNKVSTEIDISPSLVIPLVYGNITLEQILPETDDNSEAYIFIDNDKLLHIKYSSVLDSFAMSRFIDQFPNQDTSVIFTSGSGTTIDYDFSSTIFNSGIPIVSELPTEYTLKSENGDEIYVDSLRVESGSIVVNMSAGFNSVGSYSVEMPGVKHPVTKESLKVFFNADGSSSEQSIDLTGYIIELISPITGLRNKLEINYALSIEKGTNNPINDGAEITCSVVTNSLKFNEIYGYIGQYSTDLEPYTLALGLGDLFEGNLYIADPKITLSVENSFGLPIRTTLFDTEAIFNDGTNIPLTFDAANNPKDIAFPSRRNPNEIGDVKNDAIYINNTTSNITEILASLPDSLAMAGKYEINADGVNHENFIISDSYLKASIDLDLPLDFELANFVFSDTVDMDLNEMITNLEYVTKLELDVNFTNGFPIEVKVQAYFYEQISETDETIALLPTDSLMLNKLIIASANTSNGAVTSTTSSYVNVSITDEKLEKIQNTKYLIIKLNIETDNAGTGSSPYNPVKIYSTNSFGFKVGAKASASAQFE